jgi:long-chain acyl-CoA synthetase
LLLWPLLNRLVASKVQARLGGNMYLAVSGGAALPPPVARTFIGLGLNVVQGYGMTESSPVLTANRLSDNQPSSVGKALPGVELRIGENEELLAKSPGVMMGYWNNHQATSETITTDGWLRTGDKAEIKDGFVYITGRIKDIMVMSNGEKIPPADMENAIALDPLFEQALLIGEGRPFISALVVLNSEEWFPLARQHSLDPFEEKSLADRRLQSSLLKKIAEALHDFPGYAKVRRVTPLLEAWTVDNDLLTPTLKVKRAKVLTRHGDLIERMYAD